MSDEWIFYQCQMEEHAASVFYDHGIRDQIDEIAPPNFLWIEILMNNARDDGLSSAEEADLLYAFEDDLEAVVNAANSLWVGRVTVNGRRFFHVFTADGTEEWSPRIAELAARHGYKASCSVNPDTERAAYWRDLFPTEDDWQVITDMRLLDTLRENGDDGTTVRQVDHWAYFDAREAADEYAIWLSSQGYEVNEAGPDDEGYRVQFKHETAVCLNEITTHTISLRRKADELNGRYDGWETFVCKTNE